MVGHSNRPRKPPTPGTLIKHVKRQCEQRVVQEDALGVSTLVASKVLAQVRISRIHQIGGRTLFSWSFNMSLGDMLFIFQVFFGALPQPLLDECPIFPGICVDTVISNRVRNVVYTYASRGTNLARYSFKSTSNLH